MGNNFNESKTKELDKAIDRYIFLDDTIKQYQGMRDELKNIIIKSYEDLKIDKRGDLRLVNKKIPKLLTIKELKSEFNDSENSELLNSVVIRLMIDETKNSLFYESNLQKSIVNAFEKKLNNLFYSDNFNVKDLKRDK